MSLIIISAAALIDKLSFLGESNASVVQTTRHGEKW